jgi:uncharacterized membrane protein
MNTLVAVIDKHRLAGLQDGIYSVAMTLLVLELKLPALPEQLTDASLWSALLSIWPKLLIWLLSFWVLASFWIGDARALAVFNAVNGFLLRLSLWRLALVSLLPFSTVFVGDHGNYVTGAAIYAAHLFFLASTQLMRHTYVRLHPAVASGTNPQDMKIAGLQAWGTFVCSGTALALAFVAPGYNMFALLPMLFRNFLLKLWPHGNQDNAAR